jgi:predicted Zn-dependent protease
MGRHGRARGYPGRALPAFGVVVLGLAVQACATNPVTGQSQFTLMSEAQEIQTGRELDGEVRREMGVYQDAALQEYVNGIGQRLAAVSHRPDLPWHFAVVDQTAVNAFALPGGYIYLTRGILPYLDSEAEMAGVLGHEIGHVTARHAAAAYTKATSTGIGLAVLGIFVPGTRPIQGLAETALSVLFLKYSREDELQADRLGAQYSARAGWDPHGVAGMLTTLSRLDEASTESRGVPGWLSTHPDPADRVRKVEPVVEQAVAAHSGGDFVVNRDAFLGHLDGLVFGDDPKDGVARGSEFLHAGLRFRLQFPDGWPISNMPSQVVARQPGTNALMLLQLADRPSGRLETVAETSMRNAGFSLVEGARTPVNGLEAFVGTYQGQMQDIGPAVVRAAHIEYGSNLYLLAGIAAESAYPEVRSEFDAAIRTFQSLSAAEAERLRPNRIALYTTRAGDTWPSVAGRAGQGVVSASALAIMNHHAVDEPPRTGERIKIVVAG